jgi:hypothetical protein
VNNQNDPIEEQRKKPPYEFLPPPHEGESTSSYHHRIARVVNERLSDLYHAVNVALNRGDFVGHPLGEPFPRESQACVLFHLEGPYAGRWVVSSEEGEAGERGEVLSMHEVYNQVELSEYERRACAEFRRIRARSEKEKTT